VLNKASIYVLVILLIELCYAQDFKQLIADYSDIQTIETPETNIAARPHFDHQIFEQPRGQHLKVTTFMSYMQKYYDYKIKNEIRLAKIENNNAKIYAMLKSNLNVNKKAKTFNEKLETWAAGGSIGGIILTIIIFFFKSPLVALVFNWGEKHSKKRIIQNP